MLLDDRVVQFFRNRVHDKQILRGQLSQKFVYYEFVILSVLVSPTENFLERLLMHV